VDFSSATAKLNEKLAEVVEESKQRDAEVERLKQERYPGIGQLEGTYLGAESHYRRILDVFYYYAERGKVEKARKYHEKAVSFLAWMQAERRDGRV
jgi:hypothetical protein